jgi:hypothetical protein
MQMMGLCNHLDATLHVENHGLLVVGGEDSNDTQMQPSRAQPFPEGFDLVVPVVRVVDQLVEDENRAWPHARRVQEQRLA